MKFILRFTPFLCLLALGILFLYATEQGHGIRRMIAGSILSSQHPQYAFWLLSPDEIKELQDVIYRPPSERSDIPIFPSRTKLKGPLVEVLTYETPDFTAKILKVKDPTTIHLVSTKYTDRGQSLAELTTQNGAVGGINAGGFYDPGGQGTGGVPLGIAIGDGEVLSVPSFPHNEAQLVCGFTRAGQFFTGKYTINGLEAMGAKQAINFGPQLIVNEKNVVTQTVDAAYGWAPRTAIGQDSDGVVYLVATDGRFFADKRHRGASMADLSKLFQNYGVTDAFNLDGGGSSTIMYNGDVLIEPATHTEVGMRYLPNAFVVIPR
jgi:exopolysaccharide biosynthesis protein